jgi:hypothetical protein
LPTGFPYVTSIGQYWVNYREASALTRGTYPFNWGYQVMLIVIGTSYSVELTLKGLYENTIGRISAWTSGNEMTDEDRYAYAVAADYGHFIHVRPWYEYAFAPRLADLWSDVPFLGEHELRKLERKLILSIEYGVKAVYAAAIEAATHAAYGSAVERIEMVVTGWTQQEARRDTRMAPLARLDGLHTLVSVPRYDAFRDVLIGLARSRTSLRIQEIAENDEIFLTGVAPAGWKRSGGRGTVVYALPLPTDPSRKRFAMRVAVPELLPLIRELDGEGRVTVDHIYDY